MRVVLRAEVRGVGKPGEVKDVADGYATNYLIPRGLAVEATAGAIRALERERNSATAKADRERSEANELAGRIEGLELSFALKSGAHGKVFGSVTSRDLVDALASRGVKIDRGKIHLPEPLRMLGTHRVEVRLLPGLSAQLRVEIRAG